MLQGSKFYLIYQDNQMSQQTEGFEAYEALGVRARELLDRGVLIAESCKHTTIFGRVITGLFDYYSFKKDYEEQQVKDGIYLNNGGLRNVVYKEDGTIHISQFGYKNKAHFELMTKDKEFLGFITEPYGDLQK